MPTHPNVIQMYGICLAPLGIITELVIRGSLWNILEREAMDKERVMSIAKDIAAGMAHLHEQVRNQSKFLNDQQPKYFLL